MEIPNSAAGSRPSGNIPLQDQSRVMTYESDQGAQRKHNRNRRTGKHGGAQTDGFVSDSTAVPSASPRSKKNAQLRSQAQPLPGQSSSKAQRPISINGSGPPATPAKEQAYAGSTFQASPAASSLPVPKLFSRSLPNTNPFLRNEAENPASSSPNRSSPQPDMRVPAAVPPRASQQSPLDMFFEADRVERENSRSQNGSLSPQAMMRSRPVSRQTPGLTRGNGSARLPADFDIVTKENYGPQQPPAHPPFPQHFQPGPGPILSEQPPDPRQHDQVTQSLKNLLFSTKSPYAPSTPPSEPNTARETGHDEMRSPSPFYRQSSSPHTPVNPGASQKDGPLHYGNRNLSPLFKAARDTPSRPSSLRQEMSSFEPPPGTAFTPSMQNANGPAFPQNHRDEHLMDARGAPMAAPSDYARTGRANSRQFDPYNLPGGAQHGTAAHHQPQPVPPATSGSDVKSMEDNLRRMLNLNVMS